MHGYKWPINCTRTRTAWEFLQTVERSALAEVLSKYGDGTDPTGACTINRPFAQQYVGKSQSCMVISGRLIVHAPVQQQPLRLQVQTSSASDTDPCCPLRLRWISLHSECYGALPFWNVQSEMQLTSDSSTPSPRQWRDHLHGNPVSCTTTGRGALRLCRLDLRTECFWSLCVWDM